VADIREALAQMMVEHLYDRGEYVPDWPEDERILHRDGNQWNSFTERAEKVRQLRFEKAVDALLAEFLVVPRSEVEIETCAWGIWGRGEIGARQRETWTGPWSPIPLPKDGDADGQH
jgi:hypothetical protein